jgi:hypothetical protein
MRKFLVIAGVAAIALAGTATAQIGSMGAGSSSQMYQVSQQETPEHRAIEAYNRAARNIKKAEGTTDPEKRRKLYERAKDELNRSLALKTTFDSLLALGRVDLALGDLPSALNLCAQAESLKPKDAAATACEKEATAPAVTTPPAVTPTPQPQAAPPPPIGG